MVLTALTLYRSIQARAKAELRETVTGQDARDVIELVKTSFDDVFKNEYGALDFSRSGNGAGMSSRNEVRFSKYDYNLLPHFSLTKFTLGQKIHRNSSVPRRQSWENSLQSRRIKRNSYSIWYSAKRYF